MSNDEYELLDQLYFVVSFSEFQDIVGLEEQILIDTLWAMLTKGWIKCFKNPDIEIDPGEEDFRTNYGNYQYLASKQGLLVHNTR